MTSTPARRWLRVIVACLALAPAALAARSMDTNTVYGTMVEQALRTLGASQASCKGVVPPTAPPSAQLLCARVPASMFGYFKMGVHGRLYEYLARGTLHVAHAWASSGNVLKVSYDLHGGTLTVERKRVDGVLYAVFQYVSTSGLASSGPGSGPSSASSGASSSASSSSGSSSGSSSSAPSTTVSAGASASATGHP